MKVCYVSFEYPPQFGGGIGTYVGNITRDLASKGIEVHAVTFNPGGLPKDERIEGVNIHRITMDGPQMEYINGVNSPNLSTLLYWSLYSEKVYHVLKNLNNVHNFQAIEFCDYRGEGYFSMLAKKTKGEFRGTALLVRMHTPLFVLNPFNKAEHDPGMQQLVMFENFAMLLADRIVSPTKLLAQLTEEQLHLSQSVEVIPHQIDLQSVPSIKFEESETLLYVGRLEHRKGVVDLVNAMVDFLPRYSEARIKLIGGDTKSGPNNGSMKEYLLSLIPAELKGRFIFVDRLPREQVLKEYQASRLCVFPSLFENFPNVCLEAMASCVAVVASDYSGMAEMIQHNRNGFIHKSGDVQDLVETIEKVYNLPFEERCNLGLMARKRVEEAYSADIIVNMQIDYFNKISPKYFVQTSLDNQYESGLVSVVIPCFNHGEFLDETLKSVFANTYQNVEIIVVNDGSTDPKTIDILNKINYPKVRVIQQENAGLSAARNTGVLNSKGEFILPLDADDLIAPSFIEQTIGELNKDESIGFVYTHVKFFGAANGVWDTPEFDPNLLLVTNLCVATSLYRHSAFDQIGGYKTDMIYGFEDWDFWIYMVEHGWKGKCIPEPLFFYRKHQESMLSSSQKNRSYLVHKLIEHHFETYQRSLGYVLVEKDAMFFKEHMSNYYNFSQLNSITNSKAWKFIMIYRKIRDRLAGVLGGRK